MRLFTLRKNTQENPSPSRRKRKALKQTWTKRFLQQSPVITISIILGWVILTSLIAFTGTTSVGIQVLPDQTSRVRVVAEEDFSYQSRIQTDRKRQVARQKVPPVYRMDMQPFEAFQEAMEQLVTALNRLEVEIAELPNSEKLQEVENFTLDFENEHAVRLNVEDILMVLARTKAEDRATLFENALVSVRRILRGGVIDSGETLVNDDNDKLNSIYVQRSGGQVRRLDIQTADAASGELKRDFSYFDIPQDLNISLSRIMGQAIRPNLEYDEQLHEQARLKAVDAVQPETVRVAAGELILEPGEKVLPLKYEMLLAYQAFMRSEESGFAFALGRSFWEKTMVTLILAFGISVYFLLAGWSRFNDNRQLSVVFLTILLNLAVTRLILLLVENAPTTLVMLRFMMPVYLGPIIISVLLNQRAGVFVAGVISFLTSLMFGQSFELMAAAFVSSMVAVFVCRDVRKRGQLMRASIFGGLTLSIGALFLGLLSEASLLLIGKQMGVAIATGIATGIIVIGILPVLESVFQYTTNITLLELTDYNHRLLRRMQLEAPGSYHHSLMVANLAENAASRIGANPLVCRVCSLFHDIGKLIKPEYFIENQREGENPLVLQNPSMAALVIKSHVKEGVNLAIRNKLPNIIIDVIKQHHGTSLITYFYVQALKDGGTGKEARVEESTYRYDGPKPLFRESAVIFFADAVEAASRSLKKVTPQSIDELIDKIFEARLADDQLSECPLTFEEIKKIRNSFSFTLLNTLHSRIEYPDKEKAKAENAERQKEKRTPVQPMPNA